jgi:hypothetical protein
MTVIKLSALAAGVIGGAMALSGATPASAATLSPALAQTNHNVTVQHVTHDPRARAHNQRAWRGRDHRRHFHGNRFHRSGPAIGFGLSVPGFSFGIGTPAPRTYSYGYSRPYGYAYGYPGYRYRGYGW